MPFFGEELRDRALLLAERANHRITDLKRLLLVKLAEKLDLSGGTMTGPLDIRTSTNEHLRLLGNDDVDRPYISIYNKVNGVDDRQGYFGFPEADIANADLYVNADSGRLLLRAPTSGTGDVILHAGTGEVKDQSERQFLRTDTGRTSEQLVQWRSQVVALDGNGRATITFPEPFGAEPTVTAMMETTAANEVNRIRNVSTTSFVVDCNVTNVDRQIHWFAAGFKDMG